MCVYIGATSWARVYCKMVCAQICRHWGVSQHYHTPAACPGCPPPARPAALPWHEARGWFLSPPPPMPRMPINPNIPLQLTSDAAVLLQQAAYTRPGSNHLHPSPSRLSHPPLTPQTFRTSHPSLAHPCCRCAVAVGSVCMAGVPSTPSPPPGPPPNIHNTLPPLPPPAHRCYPHAVAAGSVCVAVGLLP